MASKHTRNHLRHSAQLVCNCIWTADRVGTEDKGGCGKEEDKNSIQAVNRELNTWKWSDRYTWSN